MLTITPKKERTMKALKRATHATMWLCIVVAGSLNIATAQQGFPGAPAPLPPAPQATMPGTGPATPGVTAPSAAITTPAATAEVSAEGTPASDTVSMEVTDAKIQDILRALAAMRPGTQIIMTPEVQGNVSFSLKEAPWELALKLVTESNGFQYTRVGENIFRVSKLSTQGAAEVTIELLEKSDVSRVPDEDAVRLALVLRPTAPLPPALAREELARNPQRFVKLLQVENRPAIEVVTALARKANLNFTSAIPKADVAAAAPGAVAAFPAGAPVTLSLRYLSIEDAMKLVAAQGGIQCIQQSGVWTVKPLAAQATPQEPLKMETLQVQFIPVDDELIKTVQKFLTERGKVSSNMNKISIRDTAESIENVRTMLALMDVPTPQVVIEARLFQITEDASRELGFKRSDGTVGSFNLGNTQASAGIGRTHSRNDELKILPTTTSLLASGSSLQNLSSNSNTAILGAVLDMSAFNSTLMALNSTNGVRALSNPKITVSSDQQATINIGRERPIIKQTVQYSTTGPNTFTYELDGDFGGETVSEEQLLPSGGKTTTQTKTYTSRKGYLNIGTKLAVMPSVKTEDQIYVKVVPELTSQDGEDVQFGTGATAVFYPKLKSTRVKTEFTIRSGQTIAIGGLVDDQMIKTKQSMPGLSSIPLIGALFTYTSESKVKVETLIFLTVTMVPTEKLHTTVGLPIRSTGVVEELDRIKKEDQNGAEYDQERTRTEVKRTAEAQAEKDRPWWKPAPIKVEATAETPAPAAK